MSELEDWNDGYITEGCDRCYTIMVMINELLDSHPSIKKANAEKDIEAATTSIMNAYQKIGALDCE